MGEFSVMTDQVVWQVGFRAKKGTEPGPDGQVTDADQEVVFTGSLVCVKKGPSLLDRDGKQAAALVPIVAVVRPYLEIDAEAKRKFDAQFKADEQKALVES